MRSRARSDFLPCYVFVDGDNIQISLEHAGLSPEFDPRKLAALISSEELAGHYLAPVRVFYYDTISEQLPEEVKEKQRRYFERVEQLPDTQVVTGIVRRHKQKSVDVHLAVDALEAALSGKVSAVAIASGDGDFAPLADAIRRAGPHVLVLSFRNVLSEDLRAAADRVIYLPERPADWALER